MNAKNGELSQRLPLHLAALTTGVFLAAGCVNPSWAGPSSQPAFPSPDAAGRALESAVQDHDARAAMRILGAGRDPAGADEQTEERLERERFAEKYQQMHRWAPTSSAVRTLYIGAENWPFPIPLVSRHGRWQFDARAGSAEILFRRIGENEVTAIGRCNTLAGSAVHPDAAGAAESPVPAVQDGSAIALQGYYYRILQNSNGTLAAIAYPVEYRSTGVKTFIVTADGQVSEKDLGPQTAKIATAMTSARVDSTWTPAESMGE